ncbi:MAG: nodulation protein NfeD [Candidatus Paceibacterota bacterium]
MRSILFFLATLGAVASGLHAVEPDAAETSRPLVIEIRLEDTAITPIAARFIRRAINMAESQGAECLVIVLDTPGGLVDSTRQVVKDILQSNVPVVVYVAPPGARAASAGVFITMAGHVAVMAPGTNIGAAHPVELGGLPFRAPQQPGDETTKDKTPSDMSPREEKSINDTVAWARSLAELRGRNTDWATAAVEESRSVSASEAVKEQAVDLLADDLNDLLAKIHGRAVTTPRGTVTLNTQNAIVRSQRMWWGEQILSALASPNIAILLLIFGFYGVLFELYSPGWGVAGTLGVICLVLGFFSLAILPVNYVGLLLIVMGLTLFVAEVFVTSFGALTLGGAICLVLGGLMLVESPAGFIGVSLNVLIPIALSTAGITFFLLGNIVRTHRGKVLTGGEALIGTEAVASDNFVEDAGHYAGLVRTHGESWQAVCATPVDHGQRVAIVKREGLTLHVRTPAHGNPDSSNQPDKVPQS